MSISASSVDSSLPLPSDSEHLVIPITITSGEIKVQTYAMIDSGANSRTFINSDFARKNHLPLADLAEPRDLNVADGRPVISGAITQFVRSSMRISRHSEEVSFLATTLGAAPVILGKPWLRDHNPQIDWVLNRLTFSVPRCASCLEGSAPDVVQGISPPKPSPSQPLPLKPTSLEHQETTPEVPRAARKSPLPAIDLCAIGAPAFQLLSRSPAHSVHAISLRDIDKALSPKPRIDPRTKVPQEYHHLIKVFDQDEAKKLPPHRINDHRIDLLDGQMPPNGPLYGMSHDELLVLKKELTEYLSKGYIRASSSPAAAPVLFVKKPGGGLRFCVDYRGLNAISRKNRYPIPLLQETLNRLARARIFTKLDVVAAFHKLRIAAGDEWKTAFKTRYGLWEWLVMPFGLAGAPASFQAYINSVLGEFLDQFCTAYIDDILIYSSSQKEHTQHVKMVLERLMLAGLQLDVTKCEFNVTEVKYLGLIITTEGIRMDPEKVSTIQDWKVLANVKDVQAFIGFANFYRRFIKDFSKIAAPLVHLTRKDVPFEMSPECVRAMEALKKAFTSTVVLAHFNPEKPCIVETDASDWVTAGVLSQYDSCDRLRPVAYFSKKMSPAETNYEIYDKELLAVIRCFEVWRPELEGSPFPIRVLSDHKNLEYFMSTKELTRRQVRWLLYLTRFDFKIVYRPGKQGAKPDALTRRSMDLPLPGDPRLEYQKQVVLKPQNLTVAPIEVTPEPLEEPRTREGSNESATPEPEEEASIEQLFQEAYRQDPLPNEVLQALRSGARRHAQLTLAECEDREGRLYYRGKLYVPDYHPLKMRLCKEVHDRPAAGHKGVARTCALLAREYYLPQYWNFVSRYLRNCHICRQSKARRHAKQGLLSPLPVPQRRWQHLSMDFIVGLPDSSGYNAMLVVVDRLSKMAHAIPCREDTTTEDLAELFVTHVWQHHGWPESLVSDRGGQFVAGFWKVLNKRLGAKVTLSTAFHPETDGQTERLNSTIEQYLRAYVTYQQDDWFKWLPTAMFTYNNSESESTRVSPFFANAGQHPRVGFEPRDPQDHSAEALEAHDFADQMEELTEYLRDSMQLAQSKHEHYANTSRVPAPVFKVGDQVYLDTRNIKTARPSKKLDWKNQGPYKVIEVISPTAVRIQLPYSTQLHDVFHVYLVDHAPDDPHKGQGRAPPDPIVTQDNHTEYLVEHIVDSRIIRNKLQYKVKWEGYPDPSWEPLENVANAAAAVRRFHRHYPQKPSLASVEKAPRRSR